MSAVIVRTSDPFCGLNPPNRLKRGDQDRLKTLSGLQSYSYRSSGRLSPGFGLRLLPSQTEQKSRSHSSNGSRSYFSTAPPFWKGHFVFVLNQTAQGPQEPENRGHHFDPDLNPPFGFCAVKLTGCQAQFAFLKTDRVFNPKPFFIHGLGLAWRRQFDFRVCGNEDQPQRPFVTSPAVGSRFNHSIERQGLAWPLSHPYIVPSADLNATSAFERPFFLSLGWRQCPSIIEF